MIEKKLTKLAFVRKSNFNAIFKLFEKASSTYSKRKGNFLQFEIL